MASAFGRRRQPPSPVARLAAMALLALVLLDLAFRFLVTRESPLWFNLQQLAWKATGLAPLDGRVIYAVVFALLGLLLAAGLWFGVGRLASALLLLLAGWEVFWRARQVKQVLDDGFVLGLPMISGAIAALLLLGVAVLALGGTWTQTRRRRWWR